jgi:hypothetical protein
MNRQIRNVSTLLDVSHLIRYSPATNTDFTLLHFLPCSAIFLRQAFSSTEMDEVLKLSGALSTHATLHGFDEKFVHWIAQRDE